MNHTTDANDAPATADADLPSTDNQPPFVIPRDRRKYTRFLAPGATGPGLELFESPEHEALGDGLTFVNGNGQSFTQSAPDTNYFKTDGGQLLSFGQILALAGDFYGVPSQPISDGTTTADQQTRFVKAFNTLYGETQVNGTYQAQNILVVMQAQSDAVSSTASRILAAQPSTQDAWSQAYSTTNNDHQFDSRYNIASGASDTTPWWFSQGSYLQLAAVNWDHFGASAVAVYRAGHACAMQTATTGDYPRAYAMEAFACHFLTDLFSSGHLRTPRKALHTGNQASDFCSQLMHDEDSYNGLVVQDASNTAWIAYGDKRLNDPVNQENFNRARQAVVTSLNEVIVALETGKVPTAYAALDAIPTLSVVTTPTNLANWSPLYILGGGGAPRVRDVLTDLTCRVWTSSFLYASTYSRVPSGGVHSPGGAPPGKATGLAHPLAWYNHHIITTGEHDLAPSAALVTNYDPNALNNTPFGTLGNPLLGNDLDPALQNTLMMVFRKTSSDSANHHVHYLAVGMDDAPGFQSYASHDIAIGGSSTLATDGGDPAVVAWPGAAFMVYPNSSGTLCQATWLSSSRLWSSPGTGAAQAALLAADKDKYQLLAPAGGDVSSRVAMCNVNGVALYLAFPTRSTQNGGNIVFSKWNGQGAFSTPQPVGYPANGTTVYPKTNQAVSLVEFDGGLVLAFVDTANHNYVSVLRTIDGSKWQQVVAAVNSASGQAVVTHSALSLVPYGGLLLLAVNDSNGNIYTHGYDPKTHQWKDYLIQSMTGGGNQRVPLQTKYALSPASFGGDAYVAFIDKANSSLSIMTTASNT